MLHFHTNNTWCRGIRLGEFELQWKFAENRGNELGKEEGCRCSSLSA